MTFISAILLAAGESTRMGRQKALIPWQGTTLLAYQLAQLAAVDEIAAIVVVTGHEPHEITRVAVAAERTLVAHNPAYRTGKVSSVKAGLAAISPCADAILLLAVDQPRSAGITRAVVAAHNAAGAAITVPANGGRHGHPIMFARTLLPELLAISEATEGIRAVMRRHADAIVAAELGDASVNIDINTPDDLTE